MVVGGRKFRHFFLGHVIQRSPKAQVQGRMNG
jgi:hypothetical protein